jgi:hypothetical protein
LTSLLFKEIYTSARGLFPVKPKKTKEKQSDMAAASTKQTDNETSNNEEVKDENEIEMEKLVMLMKAKIENSLEGKVLKEFKKSNFKTQKHKRKHNPNQQIQPRLMRVVSWIRKQKGKVMVDTRK